MKSEKDDRIIRNFVRIFGVASLLIAAGIFTALIKWPWVSMAVFVGFFILSMIIDGVHPKTKCGRFIYKIFAVPTYLFMGLIYITGPVMGVLSALLSATILTLILVFAICGAHWLIADKPSPEVVLFLLVCFGTILLSNHTDMMKALMRKMGFWKIWEKEEAKRKLIVMGDYFFQTENMHFIVSFAYVVFLFIVAYMNISSGVHLFSEGIDNAIWKAFLVYVAYTTMMTRYQKTESTMDDTAREIYNMIFKGRIDIEPPKGDETK